MFSTVTQNTTDPRTQGFVTKDNGDEEEAVIETRFGTIQVSRENPIIFPQGLLGIAGNFEYVLTELPNEKLSQFKLLQSLNDPSVSFMTLPLPIENNIIAREDLEKAANDVGIEDDYENLVILLVVSVHRSPHDVKLSANTRAPLLVYTPTRAAVQYVFQNSKYKVQEILNFGENPH